MDPLTLRNRTLLQILVAHQRGVRNFNILLLANLIVVTNENHSPRNANFTNVIRRLLFLTLVPVSRGKPTDCTADTLRLKSITLPQAPFVRNEKRQYLYTNREFGAINHLSNQKDTQCGMRKPRDKAKLSALALKEELLRFAMPLCRGAPGHSLDQRLGQHTSR
jgi:hypothetical protein